MDHMMPKMDGIEAVQIIRGMGYEHPIVALTANAVSGQAEIFLKNGFDDYISKPIDIRQLNVVLNKLIRDKQPPHIIEAARQQAEAKTEPSPNKTAQKLINTQFAEIFVRDARKSLAVLEAVMEKQGACSEDDIRSYVIHTHGMKSALANIGRMDLSAVALKLEQTGRTNDMEAMISETPAFLRALREFVEELAPKPPADEGAAEDDTVFLHERLLLIKTACEEYDENTAESALVDLRKQPWSQPVRELLSKIAELLLHSDFDEVADTVNRFISPYDSEDENQTTEDRERQNRDLCGVGASSLAK